MSADVVCADQDHWLQQSYEPGDCELSGGLLGYRSVSIVDRRWEIC